MKRRHLVTAGVAIAGFGAIVIGIYQELLHVAPGYDGTIVTGWGRALNHEERLLAQLGALGLAGTVATIRWKYFAAVPVVAGIVVQFYPLRSVLHYARELGLYTEYPTPGGGTTRFILGAEPFLLVAGGILLVVAGIGGWKSHTDRADNVETSTEPSSTL